MAEVALPNAFIHLASDESQWVEASTDGEGVTPYIEGEVRTYAGGRRRMVRTPGAMKTMGFTFDHLDRDDVLQLEAWAGQEVMVRDEVGRKVWGVYFAAPATETPGAVDDDGEAAASVSITLEVVTHSEIV